MEKAILVLQYPDPREGRTVAIAATQNPAALQAFKAVVLSEAVANRSHVEDEVLALQDRLELQRLEKVLSLLIPPCGDPA